METVQYMTVPRRGQLQKYLYVGEPCRNNIVAAIACGRVIDDYLKSQTKNRTLCTCRLFLLLPTLFLQYT